jgi:hypothetical protein
MATDNSPPKIRIILTVAFSSVVILFSLNYVFRAYFIMMTEEVEHDHMRPAEELAKLREGEERNLTSSPVPIARAMQELASKGREGSPDLVPQPSNDMGAMVGWIRNPNQAVVDMLNQQAADAGAAAPEAAGDGGAAAATATDGGVMAVTDAGALPGADAATTKKAPEKK